MGQFAQIEGIGGSQLDLPKGTMASCIVGSNFEFHFQLRKLDNNSIQTLRMDKKMYAQDFLLNLWLSLSLVYDYYGKEVGVVVFC